jgi:HK97 family phage prohead protease
VVEFDLDNYMKSNPTERWAVYEKAINLGVLSVEEVRTEEGLPAGAPKPKPEPKPEPTTDPNADQAATPVDANRPATHTFDHSGLTTLTADVPVTQFNVDKEGRFIEGLAVPYGRVAGKGGMKYRFAKDSLQWTDPGRVKLLRDHDFGQPLGRAVDLKSTSAGLQVRFKVARGAEGDRALELAEDGVLDGLSVGVDFDMSADTELDGKDKSVTLVRRADLREVSLTAMPAFDDARVTKVAASRNGEDTGMPEQTEPVTQAPTTPPAVGGVTLTTWGSIVAG